MNKVVARIFWGIGAMVFIGAVNSHGSSSIAIPSNPIGYSMKATLNPSKVQGGFTTGWDHDYYVKGIQHVINNHQKIGSFTVAEIIHDEHWRENQREDAINAANNARENARLARVDAANAANARRIAAIPQAEVQEMLAATNGPDHVINVQSAHTADTDSNILYLTVDADSFNMHSDQDKLMMIKILWLQWFEITKRHGNEAISLTINDLNDNTLGWFNQLQGATLQS
jgi:hypothetical protein